MTTVEATVPGETKGPRVLILCRGLQASGKSTFSTAWVNESPETRTRINRDTIRYSYYNAGWGESVDEVGVTVIEHTIARTILSEGKRDLIVDNTNLKDEVVVPYLLLAREYGYEIVYQDFEVPLEELFRREANRESSLDASVIQSYFDRYFVDGHLPPRPTLTD